jgi:hypothetical protein
MREGATAGPRERDASGIFARAGSAKGADPGACAEISWYVLAVATILLVGVDLFFRGKLDALLPGHHIVTSDSVDAPDLVICDIARVDPEDVADSWPDVPIIGYTNHTDKSGLQRAHTAGFDQVLAKSALVERAPEVVSELVGVP